MAGRPLVVSQWTGRSPLAFPDNGLLVFSIATPHTRIRDSARQLVRNAMREALAPLLACAPSEVLLISAPGQPIRLDGVRDDIGLSVSHEAGLSLVAIHLHSPVGIDLLRVSDMAMDDDELQCLSTDYLGPVPTAGLAALPLAERRLAFAEAWVRLEASLKCLGEALVEWSPERQTLLGNCRTRGLVLPEGVIGAVACLVTD